MSQIQLSSNEGLIEDGIEIMGTIKGFKNSRNHSFGIISFTIDSSNYPVERISNFIEGKPFRIDQMEAEVYGTIGLEDSLANRIFLNSSERKFYLLQGKEIISVGELYWINEEFNLNYIRENSQFRNSN